MGVTVVLTGIPQCVSLNDLASNLDKSFDTKDIGTFTVRNLPNSSTDKRQIALDFGSSYDANHAQKSLHGRPYTLPDGEITVLRAKVTNDPKLNSARLPPPRSSLKLRVRKRLNSSRLDENLPHTKFLKDEPRKAQKEKPAQATTLEKHNRGPFSKHQLYMENKRLQKEVQKLSVILESKKSTEKTRRRYSSSDSETEKKPKIMEMNLIKSPSPCHRKTSTCELRKSSTQPGSSTLSLTESSTRTFRDSRNHDPSERFKNKSSSGEQSIKHTSKLVKSSNERSFGEHYPYSRDRERSSGVFCSRPSYMTSVQDHYLMSPPDMFDNYSQKPVWGRTYKDYETSIPERNPGVNFSNSFQDLFSRKYYWNTSNSNFSYMESCASEYIQNPNQEAIGYRSYTSYPQWTGQYSYTDIVQTTNQAVYNYKESVINIEQKEAAVKEILLENEKLFNNLAKEYKVTGADKKRVLRNLSYHIQSRMDNILMTDPRWASNLVARYKCEYNTLDVDLLTQLFTDCVSTSTMPTSLSSAFPNTYCIRTERENVFPEIENMDSLNDNVDSTSVTPGEAGGENITDTNQKYITSQENDNSQFTIVRDGSNVNITIDTTRTQKYFITISILLNKLKRHVFKYTTYVDYKTFQYVLRGILEKQITEMLIGRSVIRAKPLYALYRTHYPVEGDHSFILQVFNDICDGKYNDKEPETSVSGIDVSDDPQPPESENNNEVSDNVETHAEESSNININNVADKENDGKPNETHEETSVTANENNEVTVISEIPNETHEEASVTENKNNEVTVISEIPKETHEEASVTENKNNEVTVISEIQKSDTAANIEIKPVVIIVSDDNSANVQSIVLDDSPEIDIKRVKKEIKMVATNVKTEPVEDNCHIKRLNQLTEEIERIKNLILKKDTNDDKSTINVKMEQDEDVVIVSSSDNSRSSIDDARSCSEDSRNGSEDSRNCSEDSRNCSKDSQNCSEDSRNCSEDSRNCSEDSINGSGYSPDFSDDSRNYNEDSLNCSDDSSSSSDYGQSKTLPDKTMKTENCANRGTRGDVKTAKTANAAEDEDDDVIFIENSPNANKLSDMVTDCVKCCTAVQKPTIEDDIRVIEPDVMVIQLSDDDSSNVSEPPKTKGKKAKSTDKNVQKVSSVETNPFKDQFDSPGDEPVMKDHFVDAKKKGNKTKESKATPNDALQSNHLHGVVTNILCCNLYKKISNVEKTGKQKIFVAAKDVILRISNILKANFDISTLDDVMKTIMMEAPQL